MIHIDFETYSAAGYTWVGDRWVGGGIKDVGAEVYAQHPSTRVLCLAWGPNLWRPGDPPPVGLWAHLARGGLFSAYNSAFEFWIWNECLRDWPPLPLHQIVDVAPRVRAVALPPSLGGASKAMGLAGKDDSGASLIRRLSIPQRPTLSRPWMRADRSNSPEEFRQFEAYCLQDVTAETELDAAVPQLSTYEQRVWRLDQEINVRGIPVDVPAIHAGCKILDQLEAEYDARVSELTGGEVTAATKLPALKRWLRGQGIDAPSITASTLPGLLADTSGPSSDVLRVFDQASSRSAQKYRAFRSRVARGDRIHGSMLYWGAHTGRWAGRGIQPHNIPRGWGRSDEFLTDLQTLTLPNLRNKYVDVQGAMSNSLRGLVKASPGKVLIASDYSAIEAVVLACAAGEDWRVDVFRTHGKIYEKTAADITGKSLDFYLDYAREHNGHHPDRQLGKIAELASGYQGGIGAWRNFGADSFFTPDRCRPYAIDYMAGKYHERWTLQEYSIHRQIWAWRNASPKIVQFWGELGRAALEAQRHPGRSVAAGPVSYASSGGLLRCTLPSGRAITYRDARVGFNVFGENCVTLGNGKALYGGVLCENVVQAMARDILAHGMLNLDAAGYPIVMHVHDEVVAEVDAGFGSVSEFESIMQDTPDWAHGWPIRAAGGWVSERYKK